MARRWIGTFAFPQSGDVTNISGNATSWNRDASYTPLGQEGSPSALTGMGFAFRRGNFGSTNNVTQSFQQGGTAPTASSTCGLEVVRMRLRRLPSVEEQFYALTNTGAGNFILGTVTASGGLRFYNCAGGFPGTFLCGVPPIPLDSWFQLILRYSVLGAGGGGVPAAVVKFEVLNPSYGSSTVVPLFPFSQSLLGAESRVAVNNNLEIDFADWIVDDLGNPADALAVDGIHGLTIEQRTIAAQLTTTMRVETRRPTGQGTSSGWTTSGIPTYQARQGIPPDSTPGGGINVVTSNVSGAEVTYTFGTLTNMGIVGPVRAFRLAVYYASGSGTHQLIFRRNGVSTLFPRAVGANQWVSAVIDTTDAGIFTPPLDYTDVIEVGVRKDPSANAASIQSVLLEVETDANPIPTTLVDPTDDTIKVAVGQYVGNGTASVIQVGFCPEWLSILPIIGFSGDGALWCDQDVGSTGHTDSRVIGTRMASLQANGFTVAGTDALCNQAGVTYQFIAIRDPQQRCLCRGTFTHTPQDVSAVNVYPKVGFQALAIWARLLKWATSAANGCSFYRGPGHTATFASPLAGAESAIIITSMGAGSFVSSTDLHMPSTSNVGTTYCAWRDDLFYGSKRWTATHYTGNGGGARTVAIDLDGTGPLWALLVPHNGASYIRPPGLACGNSYLVGTSSLSISANGLTGGGLDSVTVASASNQNGVEYDLFVIAGGIALDACGWVISPPPGQPPTVIVDPPPAPPGPPPGGGTVQPPPPPLGPPPICYSLAQSLTDLGNRLADPGFVHWTQAELTQYLREALRTYNAYTLSYRNQDSFVVQTGEPLYDLPTQIPTLRGYNVLDQDLIIDIEYALMEPPTPTVWTGSVQFTLQDVIDALQRRRDQFLRETGAVLYREITTPTPPVSGRVPLARNVTMLRRVTWTTAGGTVIPLRRDDEWSLTNYRRLWREVTVDPTTQWPTVYSVGVTPPLVLQLAAPPDAQGTLDTLAILIGAPLDPVAGVLIGVPDDWAWVVKFGALADLLSRDGTCYDPQRAAYCEARWKLGLQLASVASVVLAAQIDGQSARISSLSDMDTYRRTWQTTPGTPRQVLIAGQNIVGVSPPPSLSHLVTVTLDVVANMPVPSIGGDCVNDGIDLSVLDTLYDYVEHLALFKEGPGQLDASMALYERFARACGVTKSLEQAKVPNRGAILQQTNQDERVKPRLLPPENSSS